jgi:hypothetical protein
MLIEAGALVLSIEGRDDERRVANQRLDPVKRVTSTAIWQLELQQAHDTASSKHIQHGKQRL